MTNLIINNPYRILGVFSNSPKKEMLSNITKMKAFLKVGKNVSFPLDLPSFLPKLDRNDGIVTNAQSAIELPLDQLKHSLFWFIKITPIDEIAFNHLFGGNLNQAKEIWQKKECVSSLLNLMTCAAIEEDYSAFAFCADRLFQNYPLELCSAINETLKLSSGQLTATLAQILQEEGNIDLAILAKIPDTSPDWKRAFGDSITKPLIEEINAAINEAKNVKGTGLIYSAGIKLMNSTKEALAQLKQLMGTSDMQYQMIADKLAQTILQCGINYFNDSNDDDAPQKAMVLQKYALSIAVGQMAKDRCKENVDILKNIGPDYAIRNEMESLGKLLKRFKNISSYSSSSIFDRYTSDPLLGRKKSTYSELDILDLIKDAQPILNKIKAKLGANSDIYLKISSAVASAAINALVDIVNKEQESVSIYGTSAGLMLRPTIESAVRTMSIIGNLDMTQQCRTYYNNNNSTLNSINRQLQPRSTSSSSGCYIATMAYGNYDHPQVMVLRDFRDSFLAHRTWGKRFISYYYAHSPNWVKKLENHRTINVIIRKSLDAFVLLWKNISHYE